VLAHILLVFHVEVLILFHVMQLTRIVLDGRKPLTPTLFQSLLSRYEPRFSYFGGATDPR
jgi:hypothetical protein